MFDDLDDLLEDPVPPQSKLASRAKSSYPIASSAQTAAKKKHDEDDFDWNPPT